MVLPSNAVPPDGTWFARELGRLRDEMREGLASVASSFRPQVDFLLHQTESDTIAAGIYESFNTGVDEIWLPHGSTDPALTVTTSSTGVLQVVVAGTITVECIEAYETVGYIGFDVLDAVGATVVAPSRDQAMQLGWVADSGLAQGPAVVISGSSRPIIVSLAPDTAYTLRVRHGCRYDDGAGGPLVQMNFGWSDESITVTKLGM